MHVCTHTYTVILYQVFVRVESCDSGVDMFPCACEVVVKVDDLILVFTRCDNSSILQTFGQGTEPDGFALFRHPDGQTFSVRLFII